MSDLDYELVSRQLNEAVDAWTVAMKEMLDAFAVVADGLASYVAAVRPAIDSPVEPEEER